MTAADRAEALEGELRDLARDIDADLGILSRFRGTANPTSTAYQFRDLGPDDRAALIDLHDRITEIRTDDDASALVATFEQAGEPA